MLRKKVAMLEKLLTRAQKAYYYYGQPILSDARYDELIEKLRKYHPDSEVIKRIGSKVPKDTPLQKVAHRIAMGSQSKVNTVDDFLAWTKKIEVQNDIFAVQEKVDGLSVELIYEFGKLVHAITRGDGNTGESITHNVWLMRNVKEKLPGFSGSLRGEIFIKKAVYEKYFKNANYANPRNAAAGIARRKIPQGADKLKVYYFDVNSDNDEFNTEVEKIVFIKKKLGLKTVNSCIGNTDFVLAAYQQYLKTVRASLAYDIDALVIKLNSLEKQQKLGEVDGRPKGQVAWKFEAETADTKLVSIRWDIGLTGRLTPVAVLRPVELGGTKVKHASLHNYGNIKKLNIALGDIVRVSKRGDIIPQVESRVSKGSTHKEIEYPEYCPVCKEATIFEGEFLVCSNARCQARQKGDWQKWIKTLELDFLGDAFVDKVFEAYDVKGIWQLYKMSVELIARLPGYAKKSAARIYEQIHAKNELQLVTFLAALNISNVSSQTFQAVLDAGFDTIDKIQKLTTDQAIGIHNVGEITANQLVDGIARKEKTIRKLLKYVKIKEQQVGVLSGKSFCFTGEIAIRRPLAQRLVLDNGGIVKSSVGKGLDYLVQADPTSQTTKTKKANEYKVSIISGEEFMKMVNMNLDTLKQYTGQA